jgi:hypothetical protein
MFGAASENLASKHGSEPVVITISDEELAPMRPILLIAARSVI